MGLVLVAALAAGAPRVPSPVQDDASREAASRRIRPRASAAVAASSVVDSLQDVVARFELTRSAGTDFAALTAAPDEGGRPVAAALEVDGDALAVRFDPREAVYLAYLPVEALELSSARTFGSGLVVTADAAAGAEPVVHTFALFVQAIQEPLTWVEDEAAYSTTLVVGVDAPGGDGISRVLPHPLAVQLTTHGGPVAVDPDRLVIERTGNEGQVRSKLRCAPGATAPKVTARSHLGQTVFAFGLMRELRSLALACNPSSITGLGMEETEVTVRLVAADRRPWLSPEPLEVQLRATSGRIASRVVVPAGSDRASAALRSGLVGAESVTATAGGVGDASAIVTFRPPWERLGYAALGGALGVAIRLLQRGVHGARPSRRRAALELSLGAVVGGAVTLAAAFGTYVTGVPPYAVNHDLGAMLLGLAGGLAGPDVLKPLFGRA